MGEPLQSLNHLAVRVADMNRAIWFYRDVLMLHLSGADGHQAFFHCGEMELVLIHDPSERDRWGQMAHFGFKVDDPEQIDFFAQRVREAGCPDVNGPKNIPGGGRAVYFSDPDGMVIEIYC